MNPQGPRGIWRFAGREFHEASHELYVHGRPVALEGKPFELLCFLLRRPGDVVTRDELVEGVWAGRVVSDAALSRTVMKLRQALDDNDQRLIATVHGYGYRLAVPVESVDPETADVPSILSADTAPRSARRTLAAAVAALALTLVVVFAWNRLGTADAPRLALLPVAVEPSVEADWAELGVMAYLSGVLGREFEVLDDTRVLGSVEGSEPARAVARLRGLYGPLDVLETSLSGAGQGVALRFKLHRHGDSPLAGTINAASPLAAADKLLERLHRAFGRDTASMETGPLARELFARGRAAMLAGDARGARDYLLASLREEPAQPWARYELALAQRQLGELDEARAALEKLAAEPGTEPRLAAGTHSALAILHWRGGDLARAKEGYRRALEIAEAQGFSDIVPGLLLNLGIAASSRGDYRAARELYLRALQRSRARGEPATQARVHNSLGVLAWKRGDVDASYEQHVRSLEIRREIDQPRDLAASLNNLATVALVRGGWGEAESLLHEAAALREELGDGAGLATSRRNLAKLAMLQGRLESAETLVLESLALAADHGYASAEAAGFLLAGKIAAERGDAGTARERYEAAVEAYRAIGKPDDVLGAHLAAARLPDTDLAAARTLADSVLAETDHPDHLRARALLLRASLLAKDDSSAAARDWKQALAVADELGHVELAIEAALGYAEMLIDRGLTDEAEPLLARLGEWPDHVPALRLRARFWQALGDERRVAELRERVESLETRDSPPSAGRL